MKKLTKIMIVISIVYTVILITTGLLIHFYNKSWWWFFWVAIIPIVVTGSIRLIIFIRSRPVKKEAIEEEDTDIDIQEQKKFIENWIMTNNDFPVDQPKIKDIQPFTPKQEGEHKLTVNKVLVEGYWGELLGGFDTLFIATERKKQKIIMYKGYKKDFKEPEKDFDERLNTSVSNPQAMSESEIVEENPLTGMKRTVRKKTATQYLKQAEEKRQAKQDEEEEGVEN